MSREQNLAVAQAATLQPITEIAARLSLPAQHLEPYGRFKAKIGLAALSPAPSQSSGKLILVSAINPTPAGEGKTTTTVGLGQALARLGKKTAIAVREPSMGPVFGVKGGGCGGGRSQVLPMEDINLHFTGDIHAVSTAHNLLSAMLDNALFHGAVDLDVRQIRWRRVMDMNDRALRQIVIGLGGRLMGVPREEGFDITAASEVMAILCLTSGAEDLVERLSRIVIGFSSQGKAVTASQVQASQAMAIVLKDALKPNLVQTVEGVPAFVHGGPFGNIAHGCNSILATRLALQYADFVVTEAGFGFDLGGEKFLD
ncbi:MAG: formate--tetrahydrofolate ligase, partial [Candidatus Binatia bacterium]